VKADYVEPKITKFTVAAACDACATAYHLLEGVEPDRATLCVLIAHWALETGWGDKCFNFNIGNFKAGPETEGFYTSFRCSELLKHSDGKEHEHWFLPEGECEPNYGPPRALSQRFSVPPGHPQTRFQAFESAAKGFQAYLAKLKAKWPSAWQAALAGSPDVFAHRLKLGNYYTADEGQYRQTMVSVFNGLMRNPVTDRRAPAPLVEGRPTLGLGARGATVKEWQGLLGAKADGDFGPVTRRLTIAFQVAHGLKADGVVGPKTWAVGLAKLDPPPRDAA
jgi:hypothetical protein